jgi:signal transduction histidine kinase
VSIRKTFEEKLSLGFTYDKDRELLSMVYICYMLLIAFGLVVLLLHTFENDLLPVTYRYHSIVLMALLLLWLLKIRWVKLARFLLLLYLPLVVLIIPPLGGILQDEFYFWFPYVPIALSLIPHFILHPVKHRPVLISTLVVYLVLGLFIGDYLMIFSDETISIVPIVRANIFYYKLIPAMIFVFVNVVFGLIFFNNYRYTEIMEIQRDELLQSEKMASLGTLTAGIAHEINNPMNFMSGSLQALDKLKEQYPGHSEEECEKILKLMDSVMDKAFEGLDRTEDIISKLGAFSNPEKPEKRSIGLKMLLHKSLSAVEARLPYYIKLQLLVEESQRILCHEQQMRLVFSHIIRNAIDALESKDNRDREFIEITASEERIGRQRFSRITFRNSGPAISEQDLKRIFDPFFSSRETGAGMGMGMSLSYMMVREHQGKLEVANEEEAVRFDVLLPLEIEA